MKMISAICTITGPDNPVVKGLMLGDKGYRNCEPFKGLWIDMVASTVDEACHKKW